MKGISPMSTTSSIGNELSYRWIGKGRAAGPNESVEYNALEVVVDGNKSIVRVGDCVLLKNGEEGETKESSLYGNADDKSCYSPRQRHPDDAFVARVDRMWEDPPQAGTMEVEEVCMRIRTTWFFKKEDVGKLPVRFTGTSVTRQQLLSSMTNRDLILSNQADENDVLTILGRCIVLQRRPQEDDSDPVPPLPPNTFVCRYSIAFGLSDDLGKVFLTPYEGENDNWPVMETLETPRTLDLKRPADADAKYLSPKKARVLQDAELGSNKSRSLVSPRRGNFVSSPLYSGNRRLAGGSAFSPIQGEDQSSNSSSPTNDTTSSDDDISTAGDDDRPMETEGSTTEGRIHVGPDHQAVVPAFAPGRSRTTRNPVLIWKRDSIQEDSLDKFLKEASRILKDFLEQNEITVDVSYPPHDIKSSLIGKATFTRECKVDVLMSLLHKNNYDTKAALEDLTASPQDALTIWTSHDKDMFESGFRRYSGSLRQIGKQGLAGTKTFKDVVDYHYRFMIPDQFRRYKEQKRELAVRMMECIENRRQYDSLAPSRTEKSSSTGASASGDDKKPSDWSKTSASELTGETQDRRIAAKELLLEVSNSMGNDAMVLVASAIKSHHSIPHLKESLAELLRDQPDLLERFVNFLPLRYR